MTRPQVRLDRRRFLKSTVSTAGAAFAAPMILPGSVLGLGDAVPPSERVILGGIGIGRRGSYDLSCFLEQDDVVFAAVCDIKEEVRRGVKKRADDQYGNENCGMHRDFRELLDRNDIDAVLIATGPNWHCTAAVNAASFAFEGLLKPVTFLTNWSAAAFTSPSVTGGSKLNNVRMFLHMAGTRAWGSSATLLARTLA